MKEATHYQDTWIRIGNKKNPDPGYHEGFHLNKSFMATSLP